MMQHNSSTTMQLSQLPAALTAHILQFVPQRQRLSCCVLVCSAWREAAAQATVDIDCCLSPAAAAALVAWLDQHAQQVESLALSFDDDGGWRTLPLQLPWARLLQLQSLSLTSIALPAITGSNSSAAAAGAGSSTSGGSGGQTSNTPLLPKLKQLQLNNCRMHDPDSLAQLASSPGLTSLVLESCSFTDHSGDEQDDTTLCTLLQRLPQLVVLRLPDAGKLSRAAVKHVAGMSSLQHLQLAFAQDDACGDSLADLPSSLTRLQLSDSRWGTVRFGQPTLPAQLQQLTSLQQLQLVSGSLSPAVLASIPQLQHLHLERCILLPSELFHQQNPAATAALLGALQQLTRLQHLEIYDGQLDTAGPPPQQWAALTASSQLTHLSLVASNQQPLPQGAAQHMFPAGRQLRQLQMLAVQSDSTQEDGDWCLDSQDLGSIISCCPQLHKLVVDGTVREGADPSALLQLAASCSSLSIGSVGFADAAASVVAQLTQLKELSWEYSPGLTDLGLQQLTALQGLSQLWLEECDSISSSVWRAAGARKGSQHMGLESADDKGPVWQQLRAICVAARRPTTRSQTRAQRLPSSN